MTEHVTVNANIRAIDAEVFRYDDDPINDWHEFHQLAWDDVIADLKGRGYLNDDVEADQTFYDDRARATGTITVENSSATVVLVLPAGTVFWDQDPTQQTGPEGAVRFTLDAELSVPTSASASGAVTAQELGRPYNAGANTVIYSPAEDTETIAAITHAAAMTGGVDHQLARATVYRALTLIYTDLMIEKEDVFDHKRKLYGEMYLDELRRRIASGIQIDLDGDGDESAAEAELKHGFLRLSRG